MRVPLSELVVMNSTSVSPFWRPAGSATLWLIRLPTLLVAPTNDSTGSAALAAGSRAEPECGERGDQRRDENWDEPCASPSGHV